VAQLGIGMDQLGTGWLRWGCVTQLGMGGSVEDGWLSWGWGWLRWGWGGSVGVGGGSVARVGDGDGSAGDDDGSIVNWAWVAYLGMWWLHRKKKVRKFTVPSRHVTTKLSLGGNNDFITELFLPRGSLVSDIPAGDGKLVNLFLRCTFVEDLVSQIRIQWPTVL
jgi:hypothetical protein